MSDEVLRNLKTRVKNLNVEIAWRSRLTATLQDRCERQEARIAKLETALHQIAAKENHNREETEAQTIAREALA